MKLQQKCLAFNASFVNEGSLPEIVQYGPSSRFECFTASKGSNNYFYWHRVVLSIHCNTPDPRLGNDLRSFNNMSYHSRHSHACFAIELVLHAMPHYMTLQRNGYDIPCFVLLPVRTHLKRPIPTLERGSQGMVHFKLQIQDALTSYLAYSFNVDFCDNFREMLSHMHRIDFITVRSTRLSSGSYQLLYAQTWRMISICTYIIKSNVG